MELNFEILHTERLLLRKISPLELNYLFENCPEDVIRKELNLNSDAAFLQKKERFKKGYSDYRRSILVFQLMDKVTHEIIGTCGYHNWQAAHRRAEIGYDIAKEAFKRQGYMSEALKAIIDYGFSNMDLIRIEACTSPLNDASIKLLQKFNFTKEGYFRQHFISDGIAGDSLFFSLLKSDLKN